MSQGITQLVERFESLGYRQPSVTWDGHLWAIRVRFGGATHQVTLTDRIMQSLNERLLAVTVKTMHETIVRGEARRLGILEAAWMKGMSDSFQAVDPEGYAGHERVNPAGRAILDLRASGWVV